MLSLLVYLLVLTFQENAIFIAKHLLKTADFDSSACLVVNLWFTSCTPREMFEPKKFLTSTGPPNLDVDP